MRKDYGIYLYSVLLCILLIFFQKNHKGFARVVSDWRGAPDADYSSNAMVHRYYGGTSRWLRRQNKQEIIDRLRDGEKLRFAIDYYALLKLSRPFVPDKEYEMARPHLKEGRIFYYTLVMRGK